GSHPHRVSGRGRARPAERLAAAVQSRDVLPRGHRAVDARGVRGVRAPRVVCRRRRRPEGRGGAGAPRGALVPRPRAPGGRRRRRAHAGRTGDAPEGSRPAEEVRPRSRDARARGHARAGVGRSQDL
ncbi:MAG: hypothetical protein AVDCRST_MAG11-3382, partial [uncultured Gemmatimonadaceae bacterium]